MGRIRKQLLNSTRVRTIPGEGFSWIDRRFLRDGVTDPLSPADILLYWFLCSVADQYGLSYYSDGRICRLLKLTRESLADARRQLCRCDLILYRDPLYQVLSLPPSSARSSTPASPISRPPQPGLQPIRGILRNLR